MRFSTLFGRTLREAPNEAEGIGYQLVLRAGLARQLQAGSFVLMPLGMGVVRKIEAIMHEELAKIGGQEFRTPVVQLVAPWEQSGRSALYGPLVLRMNDRTGRSLIVAPTHEEAVAELAAREVLSYRQLPQIVYQIHTKYRDEARAKGGLMRMREFTMLDAYTLDADFAGLDKSYDAVAGAFDRIFTRCGVRFVVVEASAGEMGGGEPREYMALSASGEDTLAICENCGYAANVEVAESRRPTIDDEGSTNEEHEHDKQADSWVTGRSSLAVGRMQEVETPHASTIAELAAFLGVPESATAKAVFFDTPKHGLVFVVIRGDLEVNETKLRAAIGVSALAPANAEQIAATGAVAGYASPVGLHVQDDRQTAAPSSALDRRPSNVFVVADQSVVQAGPLVAGANREGFHLRNVVYGRDWQATVVADVATVGLGDACVRCGSPLKLERGVEIGHIFKIGTHFSEALGAQFLGAEGAEQPIVMGSYGIGLDRLLQIIVEQHHDQQGIMWPQAVAPLHVHLVRLGRSDAVREAADHVYAELQQANVQVLYDDREETAGVKFNDADLIGLPLRVLVSDRLLAHNQAEIKPRSGEAQLVALASLVQTVCERM